MKTLLAIIIVAFIASADYISLTGYEKWSMVDNHSFILYQSGRPIALIKVDCYLYSSSDLIIPGTYIGPYDKVIIDKEVCEILSIKSLR
jgi:hypothetical protein